jgi:hypothetical protein
MNSVNYHFQHTKTVAARTYLTVECDVEFRPVAAGADEETLKRALKCYSREVRIIMNEKVWEDGLTSTRCWRRLRRYSARGQCSRELARQSPQPSSAAPGSGSNRPAMSGLPCFLSTHCGTNADSWTCECDGSSETVARFRIIAASVTSIRGFRWQWRSPPETTRTLAQASMPWVAHTETKVSSRFVGGYGVGITAWASLEYPLSPPLPSTAVVT